MDAKSLLVFLYCFSWYCDAYSYQIELLPAYDDPGNYYRGTVIVRKDSNSSWGTICDDYWSMEDANVVCRMLGFPAAVSFTWNSAYRVKEEYAIVLDDVNCTGAEYNLGSCKSALWGQHDCSLAEQAGVTCQFHRAVTGEDQARLIPPSHEPLARNKGTVLIRFNSTRPWSTVCRNNWNINYARVVCRMLGFRNATVMNYPQITGYPLFMDNRTCVGVESTVFNCRRSPSALLNCLDYQAGVACYDGLHEVRIEPYDAMIRHSGTVLVRNSSSSAWGTICDSFWDLRDANVVCRMLGYPGAVEAHTGSKFGPLEALPYLLDGVDCSGEEANLGFCMSDKFGSSTCKKFPNFPQGGNAGVTCVIRTYNAVMINDPYYRNYYSGTVLIENNQVYRLSTICGDHWDILDANVFCRMLNFTRAEAAYSGPLSGSIGSVPIALDDFHCNGTESNLGNCLASSRFGITNCSSRMLAGVTCYREICTQTSCSGHGQCYIQENRTIACTCDHGYTSKDCSKDAYVMRQLVFFAYYNVSCQLLDAESSIIQNVINSRYYNIEQIIYGLATRAMNQSAYMTCENDVLTVFWPTSLTYTGGVTNLTADHYSYIASRIPGDSAFLDLFHPANTPAILRAISRTQSSMSHMGLVSYCTSGKVYSSANDSCSAP